ARQRDAGDAFGRPVEPHGRVRIFIGHAHASSGAEIPIDKSAFANLNEHNSSFCRLMQESKCDHSTTPGGSGMALAAEVSCQFRIGAVCGGCIPCEEAVAPTARCGSPVPPVDNPNSFI